MPQKSLDFLIAGFSKCGSTTLHGLLSDHSEIFMVENKDVGYFTQRNFFHDPSEFNLRFLHAPSCAVCGEASVNYSGTTEENVARQRILEYYPDIKLIFIARDPIERIESAYREFHNSGEAFGNSCPFSLAEALEALPAVISDSLYWQRISNYREYVPDSHIHVIFLEDLVADAATELMRCFDFLNIDPHFKVADIGRRLNAGSNKLYDTPELRAMRNGDINIDTSLALAKLPLDIQDSLFVPLGLRKPFPDGPLEWDAETLDTVMRRISNDSIAFLQYYGKSPQIWPRFAAHIESSGD